MISADHRRGLVDHIMNIKEKLNIPVFEAIIEYCEITDSDIEEISEMIKKDKNLVETIKKEAIESKYLRESDGWKKKMTLEDFI